MSKQHLDFFVKFKVITMLQESIIKQHGLLSVSIMEMVVVSPPSAIMTLGSLENSVAVNVSTPSSVESSRMGISSNTEETPGGNMISMSKP